MSPSLHSGWGQHRATAFLRSTAALLLLDGRGTVHVLRWIGVLLVLWYERLTFLWASVRCVASSRLVTSAGGTNEHRSEGDRSRARDKRAASSPLLRVRAPIGAFFGGLPGKSPSAANPVTTLHISILADPQLVDRRSYPDLAGWPFGLQHLAYALVRWAADTYAQRSYNAIVQTRGRAKSDAVVWLGDLLDGGRTALNTVADVESYERHVKRFRRTFRQRVPSLYVPGNHDIRIPLTDNALYGGESVDSRQRWMETFGTWYDRIHARFVWSVDDDFRSRQSAALSSRPSAVPAAGVLHNGDRMSGAVGIGNDAGPGRKVVMWPPGGPRRVEVESTSWQRSINARFPLFLNLNSTATVPTHELVLVDALDLAGMAPAPQAADSKTEGKAPTSWRQVGQQRFPDTLRFVDAFDESDDVFDADANLAENRRKIQPVRILFSHVPLWRAPDMPCTYTQTDDKEAGDIRIVDKGWHRERSGSIHQGVDRYATYQNEVAQPVSDWLLQRTTPSLVFSGDDHDHCHVVHPSKEGLFRRPTAHELTLKAFSMTGGVRRPGFARLTLTFDAQTGRAGAVATPCILPDQIAIWTVSYPLALCLLLITLLADRRWRFGGRLDQALRDQRVLWSERWHGPTTAALYQRRTERGVRGADMRGRSDDELPSDNDDEDDGRPPGSESIDLDTIRFYRHREPTSRFGVESPRKAGWKTRTSSDDGEGRTSPPSTPPAQSHHRTPVSLRFNRRARQDTQFEQRARRELRKASLASEKVTIERMPSTEAIRILLLPLLLWFVFQL